MLDRDDLTFATCSQLAGEIKEDWEHERPDIVDGALKVLHLFHEPSDILDREKDKTSYFAALSVICKAINIVLSESDAWNTQYSEFIKKELVQRLKDYESEIKKITSPLLEACGPPLHL